MERLSLMTSLLNANGIIINFFFNLEETVFFPWTLKGNVENIEW